MRKHAKASPPDVEVRTRDDIVTQEREYKVITPLFGGGAIAGQQDEVTVIRGTEIRGHLRFWWRACFGGRYASVGDMKKDEDLIWGAAAKTKVDEKGKQDAGMGEKTEMTVQIMVEMIDGGTPVEPFRYKPASDNSRASRGEYWYDEYQTDLGVPKYAAFMFQLSKAAKEDENEPEKKFVYEGVKFKLTISFPEAVQKDIEGALWAWETFGGIGARTRRGFGALSIDKSEYIKVVDGAEKRESILQPLPIANKEKVRQWITDKFAEFGIEKKAPGEVPSLSKNMLAEQTIDIIATSSLSSAASAWKALIDKFRTFRQPLKGSDSHWLDTKEMKRLRNATVASAQQPYKFPKAVLGLPIVFHFADKGKDADLTLQGAIKGRDRLASALILRPLACQNNYVGLVLLLENHVENATLSSDSLQVVTKEQTPISAIIDANVTSSDTEETVLRGETDVWKAFRQHLNKR